MGYALEPLCPILGRRGLRGWSAACLIYEINKLHPFLDGNKRTGLTATDVFLRLNGYELTVSHDEGVNVSLEIASCSMENPQTNEWIGNHIRKLR